MPGIFATATTVRRLVTEASSATADGGAQVVRFAAEVGRTVSGPTLLIGDFNASYWHPDFRSALDAGFVSAHTATGAGFSTSWPTTWPIPAFVRLDHALTAGGLVATDVEDFDVAGSDHLGMIVTVAPTSPAAP